MENFQLNNAEVTWLFVFIYRFSYFKTKWIRVVTMYFYFFPSIGLEYFNLNNYYYCYFVK